MLGLRSKYQSGRREIDILRKIQTPSPAIQHTNLNSFYTGTNQMEKKKPIILSLLMVSKLTAASMILLQL